MYPRYILSIESGHSMNITYFPGYVKSVFIHSNPIEIQISHRNPFW